MIPGLWTIEANYLAGLTRRLESADLSTFAAAPGPAAAGYQTDAAGVAVINISGVMLAGEALIDRVIAQLFGATLTPSVSRALESAAADPAVRAIVLHVDSPGGQSNGVQELAAAVRSATSRKPVLAHVGSMAGSAAYWAMSGASLIAAGPGSEVGSIGAYAVVWDESAAAAAAGIKVHVISSAPPLKGAGVEGTEISAEQISEWKRRIDDLAALFVAEVAIGRRRAQYEVRASATGQLWLGPEAKRRGLVDRILEFGDVMEAARGGAPATGGGSPYERLSAAAKAAGLDVVDYCRTPEGAQAYRTYREELLAGQRS